MDLVKYLIKKYNIKISSEMVFSIFPKYQYVSAEQVASIKRLFNDSDIFEMLPLNTNFFEKLIHMSNHIPIKNIIINYANAFSVVTKKINKLNFKTINV